MDEKTPAKLTTVTMQRPHNHLTQQRDRVRHFNPLKRHVAGAAMIHPLVVGQPCPSWQRWRKCLAPPVAAPVAAEERTQEPANLATYSLDPACWDRIDEDMRAYRIKMGPENCQNKDADVSASERQH